MKFQADLQGSVPAHDDQGIEPEAPKAVHNVLGIIDGPSSAVACDLVGERIPSVGGPQNRSASGKNAPDLERAERLGLFLQSSDALLVFFTRFVVK